MTNRERWKVGELLRCAADMAHLSRPIAWAAEYLGARGRRWTAVDVMNDINEFPSWDEEEYRAQLLEGAQRVEEGSWP